jgi:uncharacterized protein
MLGELTQNQIDRLLHTEFIGRIACHAAGQTYIVPITYVYDGECVYAHSGEGLKLHMMRANPVVCFEVEHIENMANWQSVVAHGRFEELHGETANAAMQLLMDRLAPVLASQTSQPMAGQRLAHVHGGGASNHEAILYRLVLTEKSGRYEKR